MESGLPVRAPSTEGAQEPGFHSNLPPRALQLLPLLGP